MSTAQVGVAAADPQDYRENLFRLLGERNPLEVLGETASKLAEIVQQRSAAGLRKGPFEGK